MEYIYYPKEKPRMEDFYLVKCPTYCESGFTVAFWNGEYFKEEVTHENINQYVTEFAYINE